jgi:hypothetical protein
MRCDQKSLTPSGAFILPGATALVLTEGLASNLVARDNLALLLGVGGALEAVQKLARERRLPISYDSGDHGVADVMEFSYDISAHSYRGAKRDAYKTGEFTKVRANGEDIG